MFVTNLSNELSEISDEILNGRAHVLNGLWLHFQPQLLNNLIHALFFDFLSQFFRVNLLLSFEHTESHLVRRFSDDFLRKLFERQAVEL